MDLSNKDVNNGDCDDNDNKKGRMSSTWKIDEKFTKECNFSDNPKDWTNQNVSIWLEFAIKQFNLNIIKSQWQMNGKELCSLTLLEYQKIVPSNTDNNFWIHLQLMRECNVVAIPCIENANESIREKSAIFKRKQTKAPSQSGPGNKTGANGVVELWVFLLELLTDKQYRNIIQWIFGDGTFKIIAPNEVAFLWGQRKNKPAMNYEKMTRALRYYEDGDMINKVKGQFFTYKYVCDMKNLMGCDTQRLFEMMNYIPRKPQPRRYQNGEYPDSD